MIRKGANMKNFKKKAELLKVNFQFMNFYNMLNAEDKSIFKKDYKEIDKMFDKMYDRLKERG